MPIRTSAWGHLRAREAAIARQLCIEMQTLRRSLPDAPLASGWSLGLCRNVTRRWAKAFGGERTTLAAASFGRYKYARLSDILPERMMRDVVRPWLGYVGTHAAEAEAALPGYQERYLEKRKRFELLNEPLSELLNIVRHARLFLGYGSPASPTFLIWQVLALFASRVASTPLVPAYAFPIVYPPEGFVEWHIDQKDNEVCVRAHSRTQP